MVEILLQLMMVLVNMNHVQDAQTSQLVILILFIQLMMVLVTTHVLVVQTSMLVIIV